MRLGVRRHRLSRWMRFSQSRISWIISTKHPLSVSDHFWSTNLHRHQLHSGASSVQVSRLSSNVRPLNYIRKCSCLLVNKFPNEHSGICTAIDKIIRHLCFYWILLREVIYILCLDGMLEKTLTSSLVKIFGKKKKTNKKQLIFQQNALYHTAQNMIEHLWACIKKNICNRKCKSIAELKKVVLEEWEKISPSICKRLVNSLPRWIGEEKGEITKYWSKH